MNKKVNLLFKYILIAIIGISIPIFFAYLDMWELEIDTNISNTIDILRSQNVYLFSLVFFPFVFILVGHLVFKVSEKNNILKNDFEYLKVLLNATPDAIIFLNEQKEIIFQNNQFKLLFEDFHNVLEKANFNDFFSQVEFIQKEVVLDSNLIEEHPFLMSFKLTKYKDHKNFFISFKDLKNLKDKEKIIEDQKTQMVETNKLASLGEMAAGIAHEINNPLTVIHSNNTIMKRMFESGKITQDKVDKINEKTKSQIKRITEIITSLRNLSRGMANEDLEEFSLNQMIEETVQLAKIRNKMGNITYKYEPIEFDVFANRGQIVQVILNLINNAIDAIEEFDDPWIKIETISRGDLVDIFIEDSGSGISEENLAKIFQPMYTTKDVGKGTGLGLSLSKTFIEQNGGELTYDKSRDNTCFKVSVPKVTIQKQKVA